MVNHKFRIWLVRFGRTASLQIASVARHTSRFAPSIASQTRRPNAEFMVDHILNVFSLSIAELYENIIN